MSSAAFELANDRCGSANQVAAQHLVAGAGDAAQSLSACRGVVFRCQADESGKVPSRTETVGIADLCRHHHRADWSNGRNGSQSLAHLVAAMQGHQRCFDLSQLRIGMPVLTCQHVEHLARKLRHNLALLNLRKQFLDPARAFGRHKTELRCMTANGVANLRAALHQPVADDHQHLCNAC